MASKSLSTVLERVRKLAAIRSSRELSDRELLERFIAARDEAAFTVVVERHGPLVLGVCRRILGNAHDAEDACQATFLVLAQRSTSIRKTTALGSWLHGVAARVASNLRRQQRRRSQWEREGERLAVPDPAAEVSWREACTALDEELGRLPERLRAPLVLCYLEGLARDEAARELGLSVGCLHGRLERGRKLLSDRLTRRGLTLSAALFATALGGSGARAGLAPTTLITVTRAATSFAGGQTPAGNFVSASVLALTREATVRMFPASSKLAAILTLCAGLFLLVAGAASPPAGPVPGAKTPPRVPAKEGAEKQATRLGDARALQGAWQVVAAEVGGEKAPTEETPDLRMDFQGDVLTFGAVDGKGPTKKLRFALDPGKSPKEIDLFERGGPNKDRATQGIYALGKGLLRLCLGMDGKKRPRDFKARAGDGKTVLVLERMGTGGAGNPSRRRAGDEAGSELRAILLAAERAQGEFWEAHGKAASPDQRRRAQAAKEAKLEPLAERCLKLAAAHPDRPAALKALFWAAGNAGRTAAGKAALALLQDGRVARADPENLFRAIQVTGPYASELPSLAPAVLECARKELDHRQAARLLTWVCSRYFRQNPDKVPAPFAEAAHLIVTRFAASPDICNFCECLGPASGSPPPWAVKYEPALRAILAKNRHRLVRVTAQFALAAVVHSTGVARQDEAVALFEQFLKDFDGSDPQIANVEGRYLSRARAELEEIRFRAVGRPVPEVRGEDLDGRPMRLSDFRGKVVLISFWATSCFPCVKLIPHERALVERLKGKPFVLVGVNCDTDRNALKDALKAHSITWRSFRNQRPGQPSIAAAWKILGYPTLYLIDPKGIIRQRWIGAPPAAELNRAIDRLVDAARHDKDGAEDRREKEKSAPRKETGVVPKREVVRASSDQQRPTGFLDRVYRAPDGSEAKYVVYIPRDYDGGKAFPLILFLHGAGASGTDGRSQVRGGLARAIRDREAPFRFIAVFPQSHDGGWEAGSKDGQRALAILDEVQKQFQVDRTRVYLTGLSMGGEGTWSLAAAHPERWAAIVPICGGGDPNVAPKIKDIPCWCFHGDADPVIPARLSRVMVRALRQAGGQPLYHEYPGVEHNCWDRAYGTPDLYEWLLEQRLKGQAPGSLR